MHMITIENDSADIVSTDYWRSEIEQAGKVFCSVNAGAIRLLLPRSLSREIEEWQSAEYVILSRGIYEGEQGAELIFEDLSESPYAIVLTHRSFDALPGEPPPDREWMFSAWIEKDDKPIKVYERPCRWRRVEKLPCLEKWEEMQ